MVTAYWWPINVVDIMGTRPKEMVVDPVKHIAIPDAPSKGVAARMVRELLDGAATTSGRISLLTTSGDYCPYDIEASRLTGATQPAATVSICRASPS